MKTTTYNVLGFRSMEILAPLQGFLKHLMYDHIVRAPFETITVTETENGKEVDIEGAEFIRYMFHKKYGSKNIILSIDGSKYMFYTDASIVPEDFPCASFEASQLNCSKEQIMEAMRSRIEETTKAFYKQS